MQQTLTISVIWGLSEVSTERLFYSLLCTYSGERDVEERGSSSR